MVATFDSKVKEETHKGAPEGRLTGYSWLMRGMELMYKAECDGQKGSAVDKNTQIKYMNYMLKSCETETWMFVCYK